MGGLPKAILKLLFIVTIVIILIIKSIFHHLQVNYFPKEIFFFLFMLFLTPLGMSVYLQIHLFLCPGASLWHLSVWYHVCSSWQHCLLPLCEYLENWILGNLTLHSICHLFWQLSIHRTTLFPQAIRIRCESKISWDTIRMFHSYTHTENL